MIDQLRARIEVLESRLRELDEASTDGRVA
jgi:hypothetical protein